MLHVDVVRVADGRADRLREWMRELNDRRAEVLETFDQEGTRAEQVHLVETSDGPLLIYVVDVEDLDGAREAFRTSNLPLDAEHREVMGGVTAGHIETELLLNIQAS